MPYDSPNDMERDPREAAPEPVSSQEQSASLLGIDPASRTFWRSDARQFDVASIIRDIENITTFLTKER